MRSAMWRVAEGSGAGRGRDETEGPHAAGAKDAKFRRLGGLCGRGVRLFDLDPIAEARRSESAERRGDRFRVSALSRFRDWIVVWRESRGASRNVREGREVSETW